MRRFLSVLSILILASCSNGGGGTSSGDAPAPAPTPKPKPIADQLNEMVYAKAFGAFQLLAIEPHLNVGRWLSDSSVESLIGVGSIRRLDAMSDCVFTDKGSRMIKDRVIYSDSHYEIKLTAVMAVDRTLIDVENKDLYINEYFEYSINVKAEQTNRTVLPKKNRNASEHFVKELTKLDAKLDDGYELYLWSYEESAFVNNGQVVNEVAQCKGRKRPGEDGLL